jgi:hypothetical protein
MHKYGKVILIHGIIHVAVHVYLPFSTFWDVTQCSLVEVYQIFGGTNCLHLQGGSTRI